jgi:hypothetical protein
MNKRSMYRLLLWLIVGFCFLGANFVHSSASRDVGHSAQSSRANIHGKTVDADSKTPITVRLTMQELPKLGEATELTCLVTAASDAPNTVASITLPSDALVTAGIVHWEGALYAGQSVSFSATIKFQTIGRKIVRANARYVIDKDNSWGDLDTIYLNVGTLRTVQGIFSLEEQVNLNKADTASSQETTSRAPERSVSRFEDRGTGVPPALRVNDAQPDGPATPDTQGSDLTVIGKWSHYDRNGSKSPSKNFLVELRKGSDGTHLAFAYTDNSGNFSLGPVTNPGSAGIKVRIWTYVKYLSDDASGDELMIVPNGSTSDYSHCYFGDTNTTYVFPDGTNSVGNWEIVRDSPEGTSPNAHAWYIKDDIDRGWLYPYPFSHTVGDITVEWKFDSTVGTYYMPGEHVHLLGDDRKSPDAIIHEMGHNVMYNLYGHTFPPSDCPNPHYVQRSSGIFCGWTEGWADFYALVVNGDPVFTWPSGDSLNLETPTWGTPNWDDGATVEGRVAGSLWDVFDSVNDGSDHLSDGFPRIWSSFNAHTNSTFRHYFDDLSLSGINVTNAADALYQNTIDYRAVLGQMTSPTNGSTIGSTTTFTWSPGSGNTEFWLQVGTTGTGSSNIYSSSQLTGTSKTLSGLPSGTIYVRLSSRGAGGAWNFNDYSYTVPIVSCTSAQMTSPTNGSTIAATTTFTWNTGTGNAEYWLQVGTAGVGSNNLYSASQLTGTSRTLSNLPSGTIYVRLSSRCGATNAWSAIDYTYAGPAANCASAQMTSPTNGSTIAATTTFTWNTGTGNTEYWLQVGTTGVGSNNLYSSSQLTGTSRTLSNLPSGTIYVRLSSRCGATNAWSAIDYTYTGPAANCTSAQMTSPTNGSTIAATTTFTWNTGTGNTEYWLQVGTTGVGSNNLYSSSQLTGTSRTLSNLPSGTIYVRLSSRCGATNAWSAIDYTYAGPAANCSSAQMTSPTNGSTIAATTTFTWNTGTGNTEYWLQVGTTGVGSNNLYSSSQLTGTSRTLSGLPSGTIFVRLSSRCGATNGWSAVDYSYVR